MSEETMTETELQDRYVLDIGNKIVSVIDTQDEERTVRIFNGPDRLADALLSAAELNGRPVLTLPVTAPVSPSAFLAEVLPAVARRQRLEGSLAEVQAVEDRLLALLTEDTRLLNQTVNLKMRIQAALKALSATQSAQNASVGGGEGGNA